MFKRKLKYKISHEKYLNFVNKQVKIDPKTSFSL